jgi:hypothetical protein
MIDLTGDFRKRLQDEAPLVHSRMGNLQMPTVDDLLLIKENVDVKGPRIPAPQTDAAQFGLNGQANGEELLRRQNGLYADGGIQVHGLFALNIHRRRFIKGGNPLGRIDYDPGLPFEGGHRGAQHPQSVSKVGTQAQIRDTIVGHDENPTTSFAYRSRISL